MPRCLLKTHDGIVMMCLWNSHDDGIPTCPLTSQYDGSMPMFLAHAIMS